MTTSAERLCRIRFTNLLPLYIETSWVPVRCLKAGWRPSGHMLFFPVLPLSLTLPFYILYYPFNPPILPLLTPNFATFNPPILPTFYREKRERTCLNSAKRPSSDKLGFPKRVL